MKRASLLDGGLNIWKRRHLPISTRDPTPPTKPSKFVAKLNDSIVATLDSLSKGARNNSSQILDARNAGEYDGTFQRAFKAGHIPDSMNVE